VGHAPESTCLSCGAETPTIGDRCGACGAVKDPSRLPTPTRSWPKTLSSHLTTALVWLAMFTPGLTVLAIAIAVGTSALFLVAVLLLLAPLVVQLFGADWGDRADHPH
jgi:hypothetical protein